MSYLHCHTKNCNWSQDDFWNWKWKGLLKFWQWKRRPFGYNPFSLVLEDIAEYWFPRFIRWDSHYAKEMNIPVSEFSWFAIVRSIKWNTKRVFTQTWWTYKSWENARDKAVCPKCKQKNWDID